MSDRPILNPSNPLRAAQPINPPANPPSAEPIVVGPASRIIPPHDDNGKLLTTREKY